MTTTILVFMGWDEKQPGWVANAEAYRSIGEQKDEILHAHAEPSGPNPVRAISEVVNQIAKELNIHPDNTVLEVRFDGSQVLEANRRTIR